MKLKGIITAMVTPFKNDQTINEEGTVALVNRLINKGVAGLFILGTNGEFHVMNQSEKQFFAKIVIKATAGRVPVYVGTGGNSTEEVINLSKEMAAVGATAISVISPYFIKLTEAELVNHYTKIANEVSIPIILYNIPKNTGINISPEALSILSCHPNIIGIKDSSGNLDNMIHYIETAKDQEFAVLSGSDSLILKALEIGATGAVAATSNVLTTNDVAIYNHWLAGELTEAQEMQASIEEFRRVLKFGTLPSVLKEAISIQGIEIGLPRLPVLPITVEQRTEVARVMANYENGGI